MPRQAVPQDKGQYRAREILRRDSTLPIILMVASTVKPLYWIASSLKDLKLCLYLFKKHSVLRSVWSNEAARHCG